MTKLKTKDKIKVAAQLLFAERGIDAVSVREIVTAAGQKNMASLHYYFRTKEELAKELLNDAAHIMESRRKELLDALEADGGPHNPREILKIFIECTITPEDDPRALSNVRLFMLAYQSDPKYVLDTIADETESIYFKCLSYLGKFMEDFPEKVRERRLYLMQQYVFNLLCSRERALTIDAVDTHFWQDADILNELVTTAEGLLFSPLLLETN
jgi:AcrR family transcriptional regulator